MLLTAERVYGKEQSDNYLFQRQLLAYKKAATMINGMVLELGTGDGYGLSELSPHVTRLITLDKYKPSLHVTSFENVEYRQGRFPPFKDIPDDSMDYVVSFLTIEHIKDDDFFVKEINRVLKKGGKAIITTPNKKMTLVRNPWHYREYTRNELCKLVNRFFITVSCMGISGNQKVMDYYDKNAKEVEKILRMDVLGLHKRLPGIFLRIPYDIMNRLNRRKLLGKNHDLTVTISLEDYFFDDASDTCFDLFVIAVK
ncbi:MAG: class I SAM-dependent methyltransferase [Bacteroidia bacterium]|nr:class I SAM-dependent methyltransferase [Bacteroidia bacterium]